MKKSYLSVILIFMLLSTCQKPQNNGIELAIGSLEPVSAVSDGIYGHFYEHIYHSANGGLWGDLVWNRSFEETPDRPEWLLAGGVLSQKRLMTDVRLFFGAAEWTDYELTLEARKDEGYEGFLILFRASDEENFYWLNLGGWGNSQHALEKEVKGSRKVIGPFVKGTVPAKTWIPIRIKVSGNRMECWMNRESVYAYSDTAAPILAGGIGVGSWSTAVSYRNIKVTAPDGSLLYSGMPAPPDSRIFPRHWIPSDPSRITVVKGGALNGSTALQFNPSDQPLSVTQSRFGAQPGDTLTGAIWLKGSSSSEVTISIQQKDMPLSEFRITGLTNEWNSYPIALVIPAKAGTPANSTGKGGDPRFRGDDNYILRLLSAGPVTADQLSLMPGSAIANAGFRTDLYAAVAAIRPTIIRWPGGCFAELYRWKDGIGPQHQRQVFPVNIWDDRDVNSLGTDEFITLSRKLKSEPLLVINSGFHEGAGTPEAWGPWIREACEWIEYCNGAATSKWGSVRAANGHPEPYGVKYWEIDNELWRSRVPDAHIYSQAVKLFAAAMRETDPTITIIAHGGNGTDMEWNQVMLNECAADFDVLSIHHYSDPDGYYREALGQDLLYKNLRNAIAACPNPEIKVYVSEWNAQSTDWRTGMYAGNLLNIFEQNSDLVTLAGPALFLRHVSASAWDNAFINFDEQGWFPAPNYVVMKLWREHFAPQRLALTGMPDSLNGVATFDPADKRLVIKLVNNTASEQTISVALPAGFSPAASQGYLVAGKSLMDRNTMEAPDAIGPKNHAVTIRKHKLSTNLPPLSCLLIEVK
jgi:alpha-N-arabinofuranosidase